MGENIFSILIPTKKQIAYAKTLKQAAGLVCNGINACRIKESDEAIAGTSRAVMKLMQLLYNSDKKEYMEFVESYGSWKELVEAIDKFFPECKIGELVNKIEA